MYHNKHCRTESFAAILETMRTIYEDIDVGDIKTKIGTLRSQYLLHLIIYYVLIRIHFRLIYLQIATIKWVCVTKFEHEVNIVNG